MDIEEAKKAIEAEKKERCELVAKEIKSLFEKYNIDLIPCVTIGERTFDVQGLINGQAGFRIVAK
jgi:hypothetical protein